MTRLVVALVAVLLIAWAVRVHRASSPSQRSQTAAAAEALRNGVLSRRMLAGLPVAAPGTVRGVVMDWNIGGGLATLVAIDDGAVSLYLNPGGGVIGAGAQPSVAEAATRFRKTAMSQRSSFHEATMFPPPGRDSVVYYLLTDSATLTSGAVSVADIQAASHPLAALGTASQTLLTEVRQTK